MNSGWLIIGVGNPDRGDDGVGPAVAEALRGELPEDVEIRIEDGEMTALLDALEQADRAVLIDASVSGVRPGSIQRFAAHGAPLPEQLLALSTHGFGVAEAIEMARALGVLPAICLVYAIEGEGFEAGAGLSPAVLAAVPDAAQRIAAELELHHA